ncbi:MAG: glutathione synthase/RimK-type ligase-like ATP-grasp enzyme [Myxococcota bacterium]|jgi:glutathione synthase/RimK-type ligase-like ATP-grasp enzyme
MIPVGVLVAPYRAEPGHPRDRAIGRAALALRARGVDAVFGHEAADGRLTGLRATPSGWSVARDVAIVAAYDRFPSQSRPAAWQALATGLGRVPVLNPSAAVALCRDKVACQRALEQAGVSMPPIEVEPARFDPSVRAWGAAFLKPRHGAFGRGVRQVFPGDPLAASGRGAAPRQSDTLFLQCAISPPAGWAGVSLRVNAQRLPDGGWHVNPPVARRSLTDAVVNAARGAEVAPGDEVYPALAQELRQRVRAVAEAIATASAAPRLLEVGVDLVVDGDGFPWVIEVNGRPRGRLEALAAVDPERWEAEHVAAVARPLDTLARWYG